MVFFEIQHVVNFTRILRLDTSILKTWSPLCILYNGLYFMRFLILIILFFLFLSSPGHRPCELLSWVSIRPSVSFSHLNLLLWNRWTEEISQTYQKCSWQGSEQFLLLFYDQLSDMAARGNNSLWLAEISKISFSDTTWRMELKIVMNDHCKLLTKCCYLLDRL